MTEVAHMVRDAWAQHGTAMAGQSAVIHGWIGDLPLLIAEPGRRTNGDAHSADREFIGYVFGDFPAPVPFADLDGLSDPGDAVNGCVAALHPYSARDCETLRKVIVGGRLARIFAIVWATTDTVRTMLDGLGAVDLHTGEPFAAPDPLQFEAARCMVVEQYNGLASGNGKNAVVQLIREFTAEGYPLEVANGLRAFFAAGGEFDAAEKVEKLIVEMQRGVRHRVKPHYRPDIVDILRRRVAEGAST